MQSLDDRKSQVLVSASSGEAETTEWIWPLALCIAATLAQLVLVWGFDFFPSVDGPAHTHLAHAFYEKLRGDSFYGGLVELNSQISPNMATQSVMVALMTIAPPFIAEKIWLSLYFISFGAASAYALSGISRNSLCLLPLLMFCSISFPLAFGFYNFAFSTVIFLAWFGYWWRHRDEMTVRVTLGHVLFAAAAYTTHIFAFIVTLFGIGVAAIATVLMHVCRESRDGGVHPGKWFRMAIAHALPPLAGSAPELLACFHFLFVRFESHTSAGAASLGLAGPLRINELLTATSFAPYDGAESLAAIALVLLIPSLLLWFVRLGARATSAIPFATCFAAFFLLYLVMPQQWLVRWMPDRFQPLVFMVLLLWLASLTPSSLTRRHWKIVATCGLLVLLCSIAVRFTVFARLDGYYREFEAASAHIEENSTLIALRLHNRLDGKPFPADVDVLIQAGSRLASLRHSIDLKNFQGQSNDHPIQFRPGIAATAPLGGNNAVTGLPPRIDLMAYERQTGRPIDYVLVYGFRHAVYNTKALARLDEQLHDNYRLIFVSEPLGLVRLYARSSPGPADIGASP